MKLGLSSKREVGMGFDEIVANVTKYVPNAIIRGVEVQKMVETGKEMIIGVHRDPQFGPLIMFGLGGIYVNFLRDVSFRLAPLTRRAAVEMVEETRAFTLLRGIRGEEPSDVESIVNVILRVAQLATDFPDVNELDINPLLVYPVGKGSIALDVKITINP